MGIQDWRERLREYWSLEDEEKWPVCEEMLKAVGQTLPDSRIKKDVDEETMELRFRVDNLPIRILLGMNTGWTEIEMKFTNRRGLLDLNWDPDAVPKLRDKDEDWGETDGGNRVFVAKEIFVEGDDEEVSESLAVLDEVPRTLAARIFDTMQKEKMTFFRIRSDILSTTFVMRQFCDMEDPVGLMTRTVKLMAETAAFFASGSRDLDSVSGPISAGEEDLSDQERVTCSYCGTVFVLNRSSMCPNCGATYKGE